MLEPADSDFAARVVSRWSTPGMLRVSISGTEAPVVEIYAPLTASLEDFGAEFQHCLHDEQLRSRIRAVAAFDVNAKIVALCGGTV